MAEPDSSEDVETEAETGSSLPPRPPKRRRHRRTVYSVEQREELERFFQNNHYPSYDERESLAARLDLQEQQVQVWFKNRRAKESRLRRGTGTRQQGPKARASSQGPEVCVSAPALAAADPGVSEDPVLPSDPGVAEDLALLRELLLSEDPLFSGGSAFPEGAGFYNPFRGVAAAETSASSHLQAQRDPPQVAQSPGPAAPAPAPDPFWTEGFDANDFWPELDFVDLLSL